MPMLCDVEWRQMAHGEWAVFVPKIRRLSQWLGGEPPVSCLLIPLAETRTIPMDYVPAPKAIRGRDVWKERYARVDRLSGKIYTDCTI